METKTLNKTKTKYFNYKMCKLCGGKCCQRYAGSYIPSNFKHSITKEFIISLLNNGRFTIDWWEGDAKDGNLSVTYYLRPKHKGGSVIEGSWGGVCINWTKENWCSLKENERPHGCKMIIPNYKNGKTNCRTLIEDKAGKMDGAIAWYEFQNIINEAIESYYNN